MMGREGAGRRRWFCCSFLAANQGILHPSLASDASEVLFKGMLARKRYLPFEKRFAACFRTMYLFVDKPQDQSK